MKTDNLKMFKKFIVIGELGPMAWDKDQFCYCSKEGWQDDHFPLRLYSYKRAKELIRKSNANRTKWKMEPNSFKLMPVKI